MRCATAGGLCLLLFGINVDFADDFDKTHILALSWLVHAHY